MKIDFSSVLKGLDGKELKGDLKGEKSLTLGSVCVESLMASFPDEERLSGNDKVKRFKLAQKIYNRTPVDITVEDASLIKELIGKAYGPLIVGQVWDLLENNKEVSAE